MRLKRIWKDAEEIAAISDNLILPPTWYELKDRERDLDG